MLRSAIVNVTNYYLQMATGKTPAEMEAIIWQHDSVDGVDHGASCAAFASLTLELAAQVVGQQSWVTGGTSYPWPLHKWADVRVDPNSASPGITSVLQDAQAHQRWHPLGDGYDPLPGDWVLFDGHVEVVTEYASGLLHTVGGDSLPNLSVNAHEYRGTLDAQGVVGFVNNGKLPGTTSKTPAPSGKRPPGAQQAVTGQPTTGQPTTGQAAAAQPATQHAGTRPAATEHAATGQAAKGQAATGQAATGQAAATGQPAAGQAAIPGQTVSGQAGTAQTVSGQATIPGAPAVDSPSASPEQSGDAAIPGIPTDAGVPGAGGAGAATASQTGAPGAAAIPGLPATAHTPSAASTVPSATPQRTQHPSPAATPVHDANAQQAFISAVAPGAVAAQRRYGVPASVTIAQAIEESGWGASYLSTKDHNLFGIKGTGPAGSDPMPTQEYENGQSVTHIALFRVYHNAAESINDHGKLLANSGYYRQAMAARQDPDAFAAALAGVYATDPGYGAKLIGLMQRYDLYRYDVATLAGIPRAATPGRVKIPGPPIAPAPSASPAPSAPSVTRTPAPTPTPAATATPTTAPVPAPTPALPQTPALTQMPASTQKPGLAAVPAPRKPPAPRSTRASRSSSSVRNRPSQYRQDIPQSVKNAFTMTAKARLMGTEPLYRDVASHSGIRWELLAACDWMQCEAQARYSPVHGEKLGTVNLDGTIYRTKSEALEQCADDLVELAWAVYGTDLTGRGNLSVRDLANVFAAFRWGGLLKLHHTSAMEFPYSVAGLTIRHINMRWPKIDEPNTPDKPGGRFRLPFGAVPIVLSLNYPATV